MLHRAESALSMEASNGSTLSKSLTGRADDPAALLTAF
jgi:hypothetical protein